MILFYIMKNQLDILGILQNCETVVMRINITFLNHHLRSIRNYGWNKECEREPDFRI